MNMILANGILKLILPIFIYATILALLHIYLSHMKLNLELFE